jgi:hypothetical protein
MDHHTFVAIAPGRKEDDSQRIVGNSTSQMHDELMVEWRANPESWGCNKCRDPVPLAILGGWSSLVPPENYMRLVFAAASVRWHARLAHQASRRTESNKTRKAKPCKD